MNSKRSIIEEAKKEFETQPIYGDAKEMLWQFIESQLSKTYKQGAIDALEASKVKKRQEVRTITTGDSEFRISRSHAMPRGKYFNEAVDKMEAKRKEFLESV